MSASRAAHKIPVTQQDREIEGIDVELPRPDICDALPLAGKHTLTF